MRNAVEVCSSHESRPRLIVERDGAVVPQHPPMSPLTFKLPKYYPEDHELTRWVINQMGRRNGLQHLVNFANSHPYVLSAHFEVLDQPDKYVSTKEVSHLSAYSMKTILFLTPLAIAVYFGRKSVVRILLDNSGARLNSFARQHVDVSATCYAKRFKPKRGFYGHDDYFTTCPIVLALRREFYTGVTEMLEGGLDPHDRIRYVDHIASSNQRTYWTTDLIEYALRLMVTRPGFDVVHLLMSLASPGPSGRCFYNVMTYDVYTYNDGGKWTTVWFSLFRRVCRRGISRAYVNCANRLIDVLEILGKLGFFRHESMPTGPVDYNNIGPGRTAMKRQQSAQRVSLFDIPLLPASEAEEARRGIAIDRDECFAFLVIWLNRLKNRCLFKPYQRLAKVLIEALTDTKMLENFIFPPSHVDPTVTLWPQWIELGTELAQQIPNTSWKSCNEEINILSEDHFDSYMLEPQKAHEIRMELKKMALTRGLLDDKACNTLKEPDPTLIPASDQCVKPATAPAAAGKPQTKTIKSDLTAEKRVTFDEAKQCGDTGSGEPTTRKPSNPQPPRSRNPPTGESLAHCAGEQQGDSKGHQSRAPRVVKRVSVDDSLASRPKTRLPTGDKKSVTRRARSAKTPSPKPVLAVVKQRNTTLSAKDTSAPNNKSKPRPRWRI